MKFFSLKKTIETYNFISSAANGPQGGENNDSSTRLNRGTGSQTYSLKNNFKIDLGDIICLMLPIYLFHPLIG